MPPTPHRASDPEDDPDDVDDDLLDLPDELETLDGLDDEPLGDDELGLSDETDDDDEEDEEVGLDDAAGMDDEASLYALDLPPADRDEDDEEDDELIPIEGLDEGEEYGWSDQGRGTDDDAWDASELDIPNLQPLASDDGGEEGVEDLHDGLGATDDDVPGLPPLRDEGGEEGDDELSLGEDELIEEAALSYDEERVQAGATLPHRLGPPACMVAHLGPADPAYGVTLGPPAVAGGAGLFVVSEDRAERRRAAGLEGLEVLSVAVDPHDARRLVVGTRLAGAFRSEDGGASFEPANGWASEDRDVAQAYFVAGEPGGAEGDTDASRDGAEDVRVWGRTSGGALFRSSDFGRSWIGPLLLKPVVALTALEDGGLVTLCAGRDAPSQIARSQDGGQRWAAVDGPPLPATHGEHHLAAFRDSVAVSVDDDPGGPFLSNDRGKTWARVPGLPPTGPMALTWEPGGLALYAAHFFDGGDRGVVVRHRPGGGEAAVVLDVAREAEERGLRAAGDPEGDHRVHALALKREGRLTVLLVATGTGLFRVLVDPDLSS